MSISNKMMQTRLPELLKQKLNACLTCMCMIIEQINFNDFNENLGISSIDEMKNLISQEEEKNLDDDEVEEIIRSEGVSCANLLLCCTCFSASPSCRYFQSCLLRSAFLSR